MFSSGGSTANLVALGAARQWAFERRGHDVSQDGLRSAVRGFSDCTVYGVQDEDLVELVDQVRHAACRGVVQERLRDLA